MTNWWTCSSIAATADSPILPPPPVLFARRCAPPTPLTQAWMTWSPRPWLPAGTTSAT